MGHKAVETTHNINDTFSPGTMNKHTVQWWFKYSCKGDGSLEDEGQWLAVRTWQWPIEIIRADPLTTAWEVVEELKVSHCTVIWHWKQIGKVKKLDKWVPHELTTDQKKKKHHLEVSFFLILHNNEPFLHWVVVRWKVGFIWQPDDQLSDWTKKKLQSTS